MWVCRDQGTHVGDGAVDDVVGEDRLDLSLVQLADSAGNALTVRVSLVHVSSEQKGTVGGPNSHGRVRGGKDGDTDGALEGLEKVSLLDQAGKGGDSGRGDGAEVGREVEDPVDHVNLEVGGGSGVLSVGDVSLDDSESRRVGRLSLEDQRSGSVAGELKLTSAEEGSGDGVVRGGSDSAARVGVVEDVVGEDLGEEGGVARDGFWDGRESLVVGSEDGLVSAGELAEESLSLGCVGDRGRDGHERGEAGSTGG